jgi:hypothetical protein
MMAFRKVGFEVDYYVPGALRTKPKETRGQGSHESDSRMRKVTDLEKDPLESKSLKIGTSTGTDSNRIKGGRWFNPASHRRGMQKHGPAQNQYTQITSRLSFEPNSSAESRTAVHEQDSVSENERKQTKDLIQQRS